MADRKSSSEWGRIELEYLAGEYSVREIADRHEVAESTIRKRAKAAGWVRKAKKVRTVRTDAERALSAPPPPPSDPEKPLDAAEIANAGRGLVDRMLDELDVVTSRRGELEDMIEAATADDEEDDRRIAMERAVSLPTRANTLKTLALALKTINEASAPLGKKAAKQQAATEVASRFRGVGPPTLRSVK